MYAWKHSNTPGKDFKAGNTEDKGEVEINNEEGLISKSKGGSFGIEKLLWAEFGKEKRVE